MNSISDANPQSNKDVALFKLEVPFSANEPSPDSRKTQISQNTDHPLYAASHAKELNRIMNKGVFFLLQAS